MENSIVQLTNTKAREISNALPFINTYQEDWDYDSCGSTINLEKELIVEDSKTNKYYLNIDFDLVRNSDAVLVDSCIKILSIYNEDNDKLEFSDYQNEMIIKEIVKLIK